MTISKKVDNFTICYKLLRTTFDNPLFTPMSTVITLIRPKASECLQTNQIVKIIYKLINTILVNMFKDNFEKPSSSIRFLYNTGIFPRMLP